MPIITQLFAVVRGLWMLCAGALGALCGGFLSPFLTADGAEVFVRWQTPVVRWQNLSSRPGYVRIHTVTSWSQHITLFLPIFRFLIRFFLSFPLICFSCFFPKVERRTQKIARWLLPFCYIEFRTSICGRASCP